VDVIVTVRCDTRHCRPRLRTVGQSHPRPLAKGPDCHLFVGFPLRRGCFL
jgi:hypothetical protein